jgi:hypothetical protein
MYVSEATVCDLFVYSPACSVTVEVHRGEQFLQEIIPKIENLFFCHSRFLSYGFYGTFRSAVFQFQFLCLSFLQVVGRGSGALSSVTHAHSTSHSQTYTTTFIHPWAPFPTGLEPVLTSRCWSKEC